MATPTTTAMTIATVVIAALKNRKLQPRIADFSASARRTRSSSACFLATSASILAASAAALAASACSLASVSCGVGPLGGVSQPAIVERKTSSRSSAKHVLHQIRSASTSVDARGNSMTRRRAMQLASTIVFAPRFHRTRASSFLISTVEPTSGSIMAMPDRRVRLRGPFSGRVRIGEKPEIREQLRQFVY